MLRERFASMRLDIEAFSSLKYIGIQTQTLPTSFTELKMAVQAELENTSVRSARYPQVVFRALKVSLHKIFSAFIHEILLIIFSIVLKFK